MNCWVWFVTLGNKCIYLPAKYHETVTVFSNVKSYVMLKLLWG
jgi:hypothetical protein